MQLAITLQPELLLGSSIGAIVLMAYALLSEHRALVRFVVACVALWFFWYFSWELMPFWTLAMLIHKPEYIQIWSCLIVPAAFCLWMFWRFFTQGYTTAWIAFGLTGVILLWISVLPYVILIGLPLSGDNRLLHVLTEPIKW